MTTPRGSRLKALLVDVGGTLVEEEPSIGRRELERLLIRRLAEAFGEERPWFRPLATNPFTVGQAPGWEQRTAELIAAFLDELGVETTAEEVDRVCRACAVPLKAVFRLEPGAWEAMCAAKDLGLRLAICTNTVWRSDSDVRRDWEELGFGGLFDAYISSHSTGFAKPHPAIVRRALAALDVEAGRAAILGNRPDVDVLAARASGIRAIWKRPPDFVGKADPAPDATIDDLHELPPLLAAWRT